MMKERFGWVFGKPIQVLFEELMLRPEFSELKKIKVDFGFGLCIDGKSLIKTRHKQRFYFTF